MAGVEPEDITLSYSSLERGKVKASSEMSVTIKSTWSCPPNATVHWDGKKVESLTSKYFKEERLPVHISGYNEQRN